MYYDHNDRMRELRSYWDRQDVEGGRHWTEVQRRIEETRRRINLDRLDAELYFEGETTAAPPPSAPADSLTLSEIEALPRPGYTRANLQAAIQKARFLMSVVSYGPHFHFMTAYEKQEQIARLQISELRAGLALLRLDAPDRDTSTRITDLERRLGVAEEYLGHLTDPWHPLHREWKGK